MRKALDYLRAHPIIAVAIVVGILGVILLWPRGPQPAPTQAPLTPPAAAPMPGAQPPPAAAPPEPAPSPSPRAAAGPVDAGRVDPFAPLVRAEVGGPQVGFPVPPPAPLPPPLFPGQQPPPAPEAPPTPPPPPKEASTAALVGLVGNSGSVAIVRIGANTYIVGPGDIILNKIRVTVVDVLKGLVVLEEEGEQFELKLGRVEGPHVAASASSDNG